MNDPAVLRKRIAELELENKRLKDSESNQSSTSAGSKGMSTMRTGPSSMNQDKDWMNFGTQPLERPTTASSGQNVKDLQEQLKFEKKEKKYLIDEIENLKKEL